MRLKRVAAILLTLPLLHLNVVRAAIACDRHEDEATTALTAEAHGTHAAGAAHATHAAHGSAHSGTPNGQPHEDATSPDCCQALVSCSFVFGAECAGGVPGDIITVDGRRAVVADMPPSRTDTPEPPPPKT